jgi:AcrR family transcriptional regulator
MAKRNQHSLEEIRVMVLNATKTIITNEGYSALTARKIAMNIGYTVGSIYMVFANMADLVMHIKANTMDELFEQLQQVPDCPPEQHIANLSKAYLQFASRNFNRWSMIYAQDQDGETPEWYRQKINLIFSLIDTRFAQLAPDCTTQQHKLAAQALWGGIHGICTVSLTGDLDAADINNIEDAILLLVESFIAGWLGGC